MTRKPASFRLEHLLLGKVAVEVIYQRRWAVQVIGTVKDIKVRIFRNGVTKCESHGLNSGCAHVMSLFRTSNVYKLWA